MKRRRALLFALATLGALAVTDVCLQRFALDDGLFLDQPLPPFGAITHPRQRAWLARARRELASETPASGPGAFDAELGWTTGPGFRSGDGRIASNSIGARGRREYARPRPPGVVRVATFGDSFTWCDQVDDDETWQVALERAHGSLEVPNFGVGGYGTDQALLRFRRLRDRLDANVVAVGILLENIGRNVNRYRPLWYPKAGGTVAKPRFRRVAGELELVPAPVASRRELVARVTDGTILQRLAPHEHWLDRPDLGLLAHSAFGRIAGALVARRLRSPERLWRDPAGEPRRTTLALLEAFTREALAAGAERALVVVFPRETDLPAAAGPRYWQGACDELAARGVELLDVTPALVQAAAGPEPLYRGGHLGPRGNAIVAQEVERWLVTNGFVEAR